jgi:hypothetical protein
MLWAQSIKKKRFIYGKPQKKKLNVSKKKKSSIPMNSALKRSPMLWAILGKKSSSYELNLEEKTQLLYI